MNSPSENPLIPVEDHLLIARCKMAFYKAELARVREKLRFINETAKKFYAHAGIAEMQAEKHPALVVRQAAAEIIRTRAERDAAVADAERYRWLKECTNEQFEHLSGQWCALDLTIDVMMKIEHNGGYASTSAMKCQHVFDDDRCVICGSVA